METLLLLILVRVVLPAAVLLTLGSIFNRPDSPSDPAARRAAF